MSLDFPTNGNLANKIVPPQTPFIPSEPPVGPSFLDTEACLCALRRRADGDSEGGLWQCIGDQNDLIYQTTDGKWFRPQNADSGLNVNATIDDDSHPPNLDEPLYFDESRETYQDFSEDDDGKIKKIENRMCTGENRTSFSTSFYRTTEQIANDEDPRDGVPCYKPPGTAVPVKIQNRDQWLEKGCAEGFLCENNTVNSLPQYCPPLVACQISRLAGFACQFEETNIGGGPFEPVICQEGYYCPPPGNETIICPQGTYCQPGAPSPTPCMVGSHCPEGSVNEVFLVPLVLLLVIDLGLFLWLGIYKFRHRSGKRTDALPRLNNFWGRAKNRAAGPRASVIGGTYKQLDDDNDNDSEMVPLDATYIPGQENWTGFQAALDLGNLQNVQLKRASTFNPQLTAFVDSMKRATDATELGLSFGYNNLSFHPKKAPRPILQNVTGSIDRGSLVAVMGGSGAGKSTFVNVLMGKTTNTGGSVMVNGVPGRIKQYKKVIGYVPQDDILLPELTVFENIAHSAKIRLPNSWSSSEIHAHVDSVIDCLELSHVRDSLVGTVGKPVISGGQRKRVSIGMELAAAPMAIFLDEPTSGLDATAASSIMLTLKALARLGISVIVIIHQPRMEIFEMLDNLILLGNGQIMYEGPQSDVARYFGNLGFNFPQHGNEGDVVTDIITGNGREYKRSGDISKDALIQQWAAARNARSREEDDNDGAASMRSSRTSMTMGVGNRSSVSVGNGSGGAGGGAGGLQYSKSTTKRSLKKILRRRGATRVKQIWLCLKRAMLQQYRTKSAFFFEMGMAILAGFLIGLAHQPKDGILFRGFYQDEYMILSLAADAQSPSQFALLQAIAIGLISGAPGVKVFSEEMILHRREAEAGHSRFAYFMAKMLSVLPRLFLACLHFTVLNWLLTKPIVSWGIGFAGNLLYFYCIYGLASVVSMVVRREDAPLLSTMVSLIVGLLSGAAPPLSNVKDWRMEWLWRASPGTWFAEMLFGQMIEPFEYLYRTQLVADQVGYNLNVKTQCFLMLLAIGTAYRLVAFAGLFWGGRLRNS